jgi:hypothetical protein
MNIHPGQQGCPLEEQAECLSRMIWADSVNHFPEWLEGCREVFNMFHECLARHIGFEETAEVHRHLLDTRPAYRSQVANLRREHERLLNECARIEEQLGASAESDALHAREIIRRLENLIALFRRHESEEHRLIGEAFGGTEGCLRLTELEPPPCPHRASVRPEAFRRA